MVTWPLLASSRWPWEHISRTNWSNVQSEQRLLDARSEHARVVQQPSRVLIRVTEPFDGYSNSRFDIWYSIFDIRYSIFDIRYSIFDPIEYLEVRSIEYIRWFDIRSSNCSIIEWFDGSNISIFDRANRFDIRYSIDRIFDRSNIEYRTIEYRILFEPLLSD